MIVLPALSTTVNFSLSAASIFYTYDDVGRLVSVTDIARDSAMYSYDTVEATVGASLMLHNEG